MEIYNKKGKIFFIVTIIICVVSIYLSLNGIHNNILTGSAWFILLGSLFISIVNLLKNIKEKNYYYAIGNIVIAVTVVGCYIVPQIIKI